MEGTTFVIAHRLSTIRKVDQILVIEQGGFPNNANMSGWLRKKEGTLIYTPTKAEYK